MYIFLCIVLFFLALINSISVAGEFVSDSNTVALWHMNEGDGQSSADSSGGNHILTLGSVYSWTTGQFNGGLTVPNNNNSYCYSMIEAGAITKQLTIDAWVKPSGVETSYTSIIISIMNCGAIEIINGGAGLRMVVNTDDGQWLVAYATLTVLDGQWHHIKGVYDGMPDSNGNGHIYIYWDEVLKGSCEFDVPTEGRSVAGVGSVCIGTNAWDPTGGTQNYFGVIDEVRIKNNVTILESVVPLVVLEGDLNQDKFVNFKDLSILAEEWLQCTNPFVVGCVPAPGYQFDGSTGITIENSIYSCKLELNPSSIGLGGLQWEQISNKVQGFNCLFDGSNTPVFKLFCDGLLVDSSDFIVDNITSKNTPDGNEVTVYLCHRDLQLYATLVIVADASHQMRWSLKLRNDSGSSMNIQPIFPIIGRIQMGLLQDNQYFYPWQSGIIADASASWSTEYGGLAFMQVMGVFNPVLGSGIYTYPKDSNGGFKGLVLKKIYYGQAPIVTVTTSNTCLPQEMPPADVLDSIDDGLGLAYYYPKKNMVAGGEYILPETVIAVGQRDWKDALKDYSSWAYTWYDHVQTPAWFKNCFTFAGEHDNAFYSNFYNKYIRSEGNCFQHLTEWAFWWQYTERSDLSWENAVEKWQPGDYYYNADRGGLASFKTEIQKVQAKGTRFTVYTDHQFAWSEGDIGSTNGQAWARMSLPGTYALYNGNSSEKWLECFYESDAWADWYANLCGNIIRDTGMDGIYLDELSRIFPCYNPAHAHYQQDQFPMSAIRMGQNILKVRNAVIAANSDATVRVEHVGSDYLSQYVDGVWDSSTLTELTYIMQHDKNGLNYFRFCFPQCKLASLGDSDDMPKHCFFNGIGVASTTEYAQKMGQVLRENGDAFVSLTPEPLVSTRVANVLANKFPIDTKTIYTVYNKSNQYLNTAIMDIESKAGCHYVELVNDNVVSATSTGGKDQLTFAIDVNEVLCIAQFQNNIQIGPEVSNVIAVTVTQPVTNGVLAAWLNTDTSQYGLKHAKIITLTNNQANVNVVSLFGRRGKLIFKYLLNDNVLDQKTYGTYIARSQGTIALWRFDEGSGSYAYNSSISGNTFTLGSDYSWTASGKTNGAVTSTNPSDSYCTAYLYAGDLAKQFTIEAWVKPVACDTEGIANIFGVLNCFGLEFNNGGVSARIVVNTDDDQWQVAQANVTAFDGQWHHIAGVYDGMPDGSGNGHVYLYFNKQLVATGTFVVPISGRSVKGGMDAYIGANSSYPDNQRCNYSGDIDEVRLSNFVKSSF